MGLAEEIINGDAHAASRLLSWIEDAEPRAAGELKKLYRRGGGSYILGITGPPGSGKSTLADGLVAHYRMRGLKVGVLAIDPSSPFSGGAVLGDRIRMQRHATDAGVFVRSMASRNWPGGLNRSATDAAQVLRAYGCGIVLVETVGIGQGEVEVAGLADTTVLVLTPAAGDKIQAIKAGIMEIADVVALNRSDLPDVDAASHAIEMVFGMKPAGEWRVPVIRTIARDGEGIASLAAAIDAHRRFMEERGVLEEKRLKSAADHLRAIVRERMLEKLCSNLPDDREMERRAEAILDGSSDPYSLAEEIVRELKPA